MYSKGILWREMQSYQEDISIIDDTLDWMNMRLGSTASRLSQSR